MARVFNPTEENVATQMHGAWFTFKPGSFKTMDHAKGEFIKTNRQETGLVVLSDKFDPSSDNHVEGYEKTDAGKAELAAAKDLGINNLIRYHMRIVYNNQVSLRNDLAHKNSSADPVRLASLEASPGEIESMRMVAKYKGKASDSAVKQVETIEKLMAEIGTLGR